LPGFAFIRGTGWTPGHPGFGIWSISANLKG
jgi:hypothetical protein